MKTLLALLFALAAVRTASATAVDDFLGPALSGERAVYFRVALEKRNGVDMRENAMPKDLIQAVEKEGAVVRPSRTSANISYWIFFKNGDFADCDVVNNPAMANLPYAKLVDFLSDAPHNGPKWSREGENLLIGDRSYSIRVLTANDPATGGRKGEVEIAVLDGRLKIYYYFGNLVEP